jgi:pimeloyl-ACP methyl ester carboxylesterase
MAADRSLKKSTNVRSLTVRALGAALRGMGTVSPDLAAAWLRRLFLTPRRIAAPPRERRWLASAQRGAIDADGEALTTYSWGPASGPLVLLIHGWAGRGSHMGVFAQRLADRGYRAVALDLFGHGASPGKTSSLLHMAAGVEAAIQQLGAPRGIVAHSAGCAAATLALQESPWNPALAFISPPDDLGYFALQLARMLRVQPAVHRRARRGIEARFGIPWSQLRVPAVAPEMTQPLLVIHDELDREVPVGQGKHVAASWPGAQIVTTRGLGHQRILRDDQVVRQAIEFVVQPHQRAIAS